MTRGSATLTPASREIQTLFQRLSELCDKKRKCQVTVEADTFDGDPCPTTSKYLQMTYKCKPGNYPALLLNPSRFSLLRQRDALLRGRYESEVSRRPSAGHLLSHLRSQSASPGPELFVACGHQPRSVSFRQTILFVLAAFVSQMNGGTRNERTQLVHPIMK